MYLLFTLKVPKEVAETLEEEFYEIKGLSWETEEQINHLLFKFYFSINLKKEDEETLITLEGLADKFSDQVQREYKLIERENWEVIWREHFKPLKIGEKLWILPSWETSSQYDGLCIYIYPGQAFGTGHHPTTQLMLKNLEYYIEKFPKEDTLYALDMGCGTGILSIAVVKLHPQAQVYAVDIDDLALLATKENAKLNSISEKIFISKKLDLSTSPKFHLILANIGFKELKGLASTFKALLLPEEGLLLLSGILKEDLPELAKFYKKLGFQTVKTEFLREWGFLALRIF